MMCVVLRLITEMDMASLEKHQAVLQVYLIKPYLDTNMHYFHEEQS